MNEQIVETDKPPVEEKREFVTFSTRINPTIKNYLLSEAGLQGSRNVYEVVDDALIMYLKTKGYTDEQLKIVTPL